MIGKWSFLCRYYVDPKAALEKKQSKEDATSKGIDVKPKPAVDAKVLLKKAEEQAKSSEVCRAFTS